MVAAVQKLSDGYKQYLVDLDANNGAYYETYLDPMDELFALLGIEQDET